MRPLQRWLPVSALLLVAATAATHAQTTPQSPDALARALEQRYSQVRDLRASFVQTTRGGALRVQSRGEGTVLVKKPGRMRWEYTKPEKQTILSDGKRMYLYSQGEPEPEIVDLPPEDQAPSATLFLAGKGDILRDFAVSTVATPVPGTVALRLDPRREDPDYEYLVVAFDPKTYEIRGLMTRNRQGGDSTIVFSNIRVNTGIADSNFVPKR